MGEILSISIATVVSFAQRIKLARTLGTGRPVVLMPELRLPYVTAVFVPPPCCVTLGRHLIFEALRVKESSVALLAHM